MKPGQKFKHERSGRTYTVVGSAKMKNTTTGIWEDAYMYMLTEPGDPILYVMETMDFLKKFSTVPPFSVDKVEVKGNEIKRLT